MNRGAAGPASSEMRWPRSSAKQQNGQGDDDGVPRRQGGRRGRRAGYRESVRKPPLAS